MFMVKKLFFILCMMMGLTAAAQHMQAPQITMPTPTLEKSEAPVLDFSKPVQFAWMPCTTPYAELTEVSYVLQFFPVVPDWSYEETTYRMRPWMEITNLKAPQYMYNRPASDRLRQLPEDQLIIMRVIATVKNLEGKYLEVANHGISPIALFRLKGSASVSPDTKGKKADEQDEPKGKKEKKAKKSKKSKENK